jgi:hypothetical protein
MFIGFDSEVTQAAMISLSLSEALSDGEAVRARLLPSSSANCNYRNLFKFNFIFKPDPGCKFSAAAAAFI